MHIGVQRYARPEAGPSIQAISGGTGGWRFPSLKYTKKINIIIELPLQCLVPCRLIKKDVI